ncbi:MAG TPA: tRNA (adenosine(37)-N6)-threonylcarbamoyltransferase complex ATPase subunit type 1 TsaE [Pseudomonadales bacterium]|nr:tRNA (adenosine(37)-N6)-threonylcarbamoyltransferase complex ATPase subunit type 1 TsaE [Pseudomonadales bacterium]
MNQITALFLADEVETVDMAMRLARGLDGYGRIYLSGELGAGKTTFCRGILRGLGHTGAVKSPTFTLVEPYAVNGVQVFHFDLYRLGDPNELEYIGVDDYFSSRCIILVEWPERAADYLPDADLQVHLEVSDTGRRLSIRASSDHGEDIVRQIWVGAE